MKKFYSILAIATAMLVVSATACSENQKSEDLENVYMDDSCNVLTRAECDEEAAAFAELNQELMQLAEQYPSEIMARSNGDPVWRGFKKIMAADAVGACYGFSRTLTLEGAGLGAVFASLLQFAMIMDDENEVQKYLPMQPSLDTNINLLTINGSAEYVGYIHNIALYDVYAELGLNVLIVPEEYVKESIIRKFARYNYTSQSVNSIFIMDTDLSEDILFVMDDFDNTEPQQFISRLASDMPNRTNEINAFGTFCYQYNGYTSQTTKDNYTAAFMGTVRDSNISTSSKNFIISAVSVANYSDKLWEPVNN